MNPKRSGAQIAAFVLLSAGLAMAQATTETPPAQPAPPGALPQEPPVTGTPAPGSKSMEEQIVVTGSRVRRKDLTTPAPVTVMTREQWQESGKLTIGDFLQSLPEQGNAPNFQLNNGGATYGADGSTRVNLRSLGVARTLVLINGRRVVNAGLGASSSVDLNTIPTAAVERIEVLKDGASAVYGSDAIAGVVNVITRRTFNGTELGAQYGLSGHGDAQTFDAAVTTGRSGDLGNFLFSVGYFNQKESWLRDRSWSANALSFDYSTGKTDSAGSGRTPNGTIGLPSTATGGELPACAANALCHGLVQLDPNWTNDNFIRCSPGDTSPGCSTLGWKVFTSADRYNFASENYLTIPSRRVQIYSSGDTQFTFARGYFEASYVQRNSQQNAAPMPLNPGDYTLGDGVTPIAVSADSLYNPFGVEPTFAGRRLVEFGHRTYTEDLATFRVVTGVDGTLPEQLGPVHGWFWDLSLNYGRTDGTFTTGGAIRNSRIADAVGPSKIINGVPRCLKDINDDTTVIPGCVPINLFGGANNGSIDPSQINNLGFEGTSRAFDSLLALDANATGDLITLAATRPVSLAIGYEFRRQSGAQIADPIAASGDSADFNFKSTSGNFTANEAYAELSVPILGNMPGVEDLEASVAGRYVNYSTFGDNFSYKLGARYTPVKDVTLRGTYSTAFRAPGISELFLGQSETAPVATDPCNVNLAALPANSTLRQQCTAAGVPLGGSGDTGLQELAHVGGNSGLKPETATVYTAGLVIQPSAVRNLSFTIDYYNIKVDDLIGTVGVPAILAGCYPTAGTPVQSYCNLVHRSPTASGGRILFVEDINQNVGQLRTDGFDFAARYQLPTPAGRFGFAFDANWLTKYERTQSVGTSVQTINGKGNFDLGALPTFKANLGANWAFAGFNVGGIGHYIRSFKECAAADLTSSGGLCYANPGLPSRDVGDNVTVDLHASYTLSSQVGKTVVLVGMNNVFDKAPQFVYSAPLANSDPSVYDFVGRFVYGRVQHTF